MPPPMKPPARARGIRVWQREGRGALSASAIAELFQSAEVLTEGSLDETGRWYGSIMISFDLGILSRTGRDVAGPEDLDAIVVAIEGSVRVRVRAHRIACGEIYRRFPDRHVGTAQIFSRFRREGDALLLDIDLEAPVDLPSVRES
ncbi:MAG: hypothetical protein H6719_10610 [Sandaracinaceae bacterium]|nr:hypothetical protein [Sandaracinaceae bacterium]